MLKKIGGSLLIFGLGAGAGWWLILSAYADKDEPGPLRSAVVKWNGKGVKPPPTPPGDHGR